ncbi:hypothetical protein HZ993_12645 [Rhodoferax sp. AJA081-3]|uniref:hypothetical protein n=1 Tax=Rhodoferax sp. AJA081-3 TaxID=2752316 RepID=UPI001ADF7BE2|nr:hypothetical protein [Rhodoferax sp. AJA081-3]QTN26194.1 hypothetical protein HZ993_12645 [Rhodoferax sp. AJA081-3]
MQDMLRAAKNALAVTMIWAVVMFIPGFNILGLIAVMLPLWSLHELGMRGLGEPNNGFFEPTQFGYTLGGFIIWLGWFLLFLVVQKLLKKGGKGGSHG